MEWQAHRGLSSPFPFLLSTSLPNLSPSTLQVSWISEPGPPAAPPAGQLSGPAPGACHSMPYRSGEAPRGSGGQAELALGQTYLFHMFMTVQATGRRLHGTRAASWAGFMPGPVSGRFTARAEGAGLGAVILLRDSLRVCCCFL